MVETQSVDQMAPPTSGAPADDNSWLYVQGNDRVFVFAKTWLSVVISTMRR